MTLIEKVVECKKINKKKKEGGWQEKSGMEIEIKESDVPRSAFYV